MVESGKNELKLTNLDDGNMTFNVKKDDLPNGKKFRVGKKNGDNIPEIDLGSNGKISRNTG